MEDTYEKNETYEEEMKEIDKNYQKRMKEIDEKYEKEIKEIDEKYDKLYYEGLKVGAISGITTYTILRIIQKFT